MIRTIINPNVAAVIVIGIEPKWTKKIVDGIAKTGKPVEGFHIEHRRYWNCNEGFKKSTRLCDVGI